MIKVGIVGGTGYTGVELLRLLAQHPEADVRAITSRKDAGTPVADMFPSLRGRYYARVRRTRRKPDLDSCDVVFFATPHGVAMAQARELVARRRQDHRPRRRFPPEGSRRLREVVRHAAHLPRPPRRIGLRLAGSEPRRDQARAHRRQSRVLPDRRATGLPAAARGGHRRRRASRRRLQVRCFRRGPQGRDGTALRRGLRQLQGLQRQGPPPSSGNRPGPACRGPLAGAPRLHAASRPDDPRHPRDALRAAHRHAASTCRRCSSSATKASRSST